VRLRSSSRNTVVDHGPDQVWAVVACGRPGPRWYADAAPFVIRGALDRLLGGAGRRWPAPDRALLTRGDTVGFWRVVRASGGVLDLEAVVRAPGRVTLRTEVTPDGTGARVTQAVTFHPHGALGAAYLLADLPARETVIALTHRRLLRDLRTAHAPTT
jgi:hypothetical protein